jgi:hypothetical protein
MFIYFLLLLALHQLSTPHTMIHSHQSRFHSTQFPEEKILSAIRAPSWLMQGIMFQLSLLCCCFFSILVPIVVSWCHCQRKTSWCTRADELKTLRLVRLNTMRMSAKSKKWNKMTKTEIRLMPFSPLRWSSKTAISPLSALVLYSFYSYS